MTKLVVVITIFSFCFSFSQEAEFAAIDNEIKERLQKINRTYRKNPNLRAKAKFDLNQYKRNYYQDIINGIRLKEKPIYPEKNIGEPTKNAHYEGGIQKYSSLFLSVFVAWNFEDSNKKYQAYVSFIIDKDGIAKNAQATGDDPDFNQECLVAFYKIVNVGKWSPAEYNGKPIPSKYRFPVILSFADRTKTLTD